MTLPRSPITNSVATPGKQRHHSHCASRSSPQTSLLLQLLQCSCSTFCGFPLPYLPTLLLNFFISTMCLEQENIPLSPECVFFTTVLTFNATAAGWKKGWGFTNLLTFSLQFPFRHLLASPLGCLVSCLVLFLQKVSTRTGKA